MNGPGRCRSEKTHRMRRAWAWAPARGEARVRALRQEVEALHAKRKLQHIAAGKELALLREAEREKRAAVGAVKAAVRDLQAQL